MSVLDRDVGLEQGGRGILAAAALICLLGLALLRSGFGSRDAASLEAAVSTEHASAVAAVRKTVGDLGGRLAEQLGQAGLDAAIRDERWDEARARIAEGWLAADAVEVHGPDITSAWEDVGAFGHGKLALLLQAQRSDQPVVGALRSGGVVMLAAAAPIRSEGAIVGLAYAQQPASQLDASFSVSEGGYLSLRQGNAKLIERGDASLAHSAEAGAVKLEGTRLRVTVAAPPVPAGLLGLPSSPAMLLGGLLVLLALPMGLMPARLLGMVRSLSEKAQSRATKATAGEEERTMTELQSEGVPKPVVVRPKPVPAALALDAGIFRAYDIRGVVGKTLDVGVARMIGRAIGATLRERGQRRIVVGGDGRLSTPELRSGLAQGLQAAGCDVVDIGLAPTPLVYFAAAHWGIGSGVAVTGSHNPPDYNGFKIVLDGETLSGDAITALHARIAENRLPLAETPGTLEVRGAREDYLQHITSDIQTERRLRVVIDAGSGVAGAIAPDLLRAIGADVEELYCEVDGTFPYHHPDPSDPANLGDLVNAVQRIGADIGLAFDGDGDRLGIVTPKGKVIMPDRLLMLFAADVLERNPGACIIYDVKCSGHLAPFILRHGGSPLMWKTGHSLVKAKMKETEAELAGEMSGHFFFRERWFGFDDGIYAACRLLEILAARGEDADTVFDEIPDSLSTPEIKVPMAEGEPHAFIEAFTAAARFDDARLTTIDGVRADWSDGWGLVRASNTTPVLVLRFEANDGEGLARIQQAFREAMLAVKPDLPLAF